MSEKVKDGNGYDIMPSSIKIFENKKKEKDSHPDYTGKLYDEKGNEFYVSMWTKETKSGDTYLSGKIVSAEKAKENWSKDRPGANKLKPTERQSLPSGNADIDEDLPF